jgi:hypothetical protein
LAGPAYQSTRGAQLSWCQHSLLATQTITFGKLNLDYCLFVIQIGYRVMLRLCQGGRHRAHCRQDCCAIRRADTRRSGWHAASRAPALCSALPTLG